MDNLAPIAATENTLTAKLIGSRLAFVRKELGQLHGEQHWTQTAVAERTGLTQNIICRLEQGEGGKVESWLTVMGLYEEQGYNPAWIVTEDNKRMNKLALREPPFNPTSQQRDFALQILARYQQELNKSVEEIRQMLLKL